MDPNACLERIRDAYGTDDLDEIGYAIGDLLNWIEAGGFIPEPTEPQLSALLIMCQSYPAHRVGMLNATN